MQMRIRLVLPKLPAERSRLRGPLRVGKERTNLWSQNRVCHSKFLNRCFRLTHVLLDLRGGITGYGDLRSIDTADPNCRILVGTVQSRQAGLLDHDPANPIFVAEPVEVCPLKI